MKQLIYLSVIVSVFLFCYSCKDEEPSLNNEQKKVAIKLDVNKSLIDIGKSASSVYIYVTSNTEWTVYANNTGNNAINDFDITPLSGKNNGTIKVTYGGVKTTYYNEQRATVVISYYDEYGYLKTKVVTIRRKANII